jgi:hypothetical protein
MLVARLGAEAEVAAGTVVELGLSASRVCLFDPATGASLLVAEPPALVAAGG